MSNINCKHTEYETAAPDEYQTNDIRIVKSNGPPVIGTAEMQRIQLFINMNCKHTKYKTADELQVSELVA